MDKHLHENVVVAVRVRPVPDGDASNTLSGEDPVDAKGNSISWEIKNGALCQTTVASSPAPSSPEPAPTSLIPTMLSPRNSSSTSSKLHVFPFPHIYSPDAQTTALYSSIVEPIVQSSLQGFNGTVFAYGQTGSGKTHTMMGNQATDPGVIPLAVHQIFDHVGKSSSTYLLRISYLELYNEEIRDLLSPTGETLEVHENRERGIYVKDLSEHLVTKPEDVESMLATGEGRRHYGATGMNERSSRSHVLLRFIIECDDKLEATPTRHTVKVSTLNFVDLAGSERISQAKTEGSQRLEGKHINKSLFFLSEVISKLAEKKPGAHIPYRDSKLTRILQSSIGGNARTAVVCTVTPLFKFLEQTVSTLRFASRAIKIENDIHMNELDIETRILGEEKEVSTIEGQLASLELQKENKDLKERLEIKLQELRKMLLGHQAMVSRSVKRQRRCTWSYSGEKLFEKISDLYDEKNKENKENISAETDMKMMMLTKRAERLQMEVDTANKTALAGKEKLEEERNEWKLKFEETRAKLEVEKAENEKLTARFNLLSKGTGICDLEQDELKSLQANLLESVKLITQELVWRQCVSKDIREELQNTQASLLEERRLREEKEVSHQKNIQQLQETNADIASDLQRTQALLDEKVSSSTAESLDAQREIEALRSRLRDLQSPPTSVLSEPVMKHETTPPTTPSRGGSVSKVSSTTPSSERVKQARAKSTQELQSKSPARRPSGNVAASPLRAIFMSAADKQAK